MYSLPVSEWVWGSSGAQGGRVGEGRDCTPSNTCCTSAAAVAAAAVAVVVQHGESRRSLNISKLQPFDSLKVVGTVCQMHRKIYTNA